MKNSENIKYISKSNKTILFMTDTFQYEEYYYHIEKNLVELLNVRVINRKTPLKSIDQTLYDYDKKILVTLDWVGAPGEFLKKNEFRVFNEKEYKEWKKLSTKPIKKVNSKITKGKSIK